MALTTRDKVKAALGLTDNGVNAAVDLAVAAGNAVLMGYIGADLSDTTARTFTYTLDSAAERVNLPVFPVIAITSVTANGVALAGEATPNPEFYLDYSTYSLDFPNGLTNPTSRPGHRIVVVYTAGFATIPADLELVATNIAAMVYNNGGNFTTSMNGNKGELKSMTMFDAMSMSFETGGVGVDSAGTPEGVVSAWSYVLDKYRVTQPVMR